MSAGVEQLHGVGREDVLGDAQVLYGHIVESDRALLADLEAKALTTMQPFHAEVRVQTPFGETRWRSLAPAPHRASNGHPVWDGIEIDITDRKRPESACRVLIDSSLQALVILGVRTAARKSRRG